MPAAQVSNRQQFDALVVRQMWYNQGKSDTRDTQRRILIMNPKASYLPLIVEINEDGYLAHCPGLQGAFAEGDTIEEAMFNCIDVIKLIFAYRVERGETNI